MESIFITPHLLHLFPQQDYFPFAGSRFHTHTWEGFRADMLVLQLNLRFSAQLSSSMNSTVNSRL